MGLEVIDELQCPTCGRIRENWGNESTRSLAISLNKDKQRVDHEDRAYEYRAWRWTIGNGCYVTDFDHIEYRIKDDRLVPVAILELTRVDGDLPVPDNYLNSILDRFTKRDAQQDIVTYAADILGCKAWIVLFRYDLSQFWLYNLTDSRGWYKNLNKAKYTKWLKRDCGLNGKDENGTRNNCAF